MNLERIIGGMGLLILVFLLLSRADSANTVIRSIGGFVTDQTRALQGLTPSGFSGPQYTQVH